MKATSETVEAIDHILTTAAEEQKAGGGPDISPALRERLIALGWTPPGETAAPKSRPGK